MNKIKATWQRDKLAILLFLCWYFLMVIVSLFLAKVIEL